MLSLLDFAGLVLRQKGSQQLERRPEPASVTNADDNVIQYDRVMSTKLALSYASGVEIVHRARAVDSNTNAVDLACGPGHYTVCLARFLGYRNLIGMDLSGPMIEVAATNSALQGLEDRVQYQVRDITNLDDVRDGTFQLASFTGAAHHMPDLSIVSRIVRNMDRITAADGLVMIMDLARLRTKELTERYIELLAADYVERGLPAFLEDFRNSMYAVWTPLEFSSVIPRDSRRWWCHLVPYGLPTMQIILGLPIGRRKVFVRRGFPRTENPLIRECYPRWQQTVSPKWANETLKEWKLVKLTLACASKSMYPPGH